MHHHVTAGLSAGVWEDVEALTFLPLKLSWKGGLTHRSPEAVSQWMMNTPCGFVCLCLCVRARPLKLVSFQAHLRTTATLLCFSVTSLPRPLVTTCSGPPLPAARDDLRKKVEIKPSSDVSPFQKQPLLCQLPHAPHAYLSGLWNMQQKQGKQVGRITFFINFKRSLW